MRAQNYLMLPFELILTLRGVVIIEDFCIAILMYVLHNFCSLSLRDINILFIAINVKCFVFFNVFKIARF